jgi:hypothetical protein
VTLREPDERDVTYAAAVRESYPTAEALIREWYGQLDYLGRTPAERERERRRQRRQERTA